MRLLLLDHCQTGHFLRPVDMLRLAWQITQGTLVFKYGYVGNFDNVMKSCCYACYRKNHMNIWDVQAVSLVGGTGTEVEGTLHHLQAGLPALQ